MVGLPPRLCEKDLNQEKLRQKNSENQSKVKKQRPAFRKGQTVLMSKQKTVFYRRSNQSHNEEVLIIKSVKTNLPRVMYTLMTYDAPHETIEGNFYQVCSIRIS